MTTVPPPSEAPRIFLQGPAGTGKTTWALRHLEQILASGATAQSVLILVPQRSIGRPYQLASHQMEPFPGEVTMATLSGLARRNVARFWPLVAAPAGYDPHREPVFLTIETAQYYMMRFVRPKVAQGIFDSIGLPPPRIATQLLDNLAKAAVAGFGFDEIGQRLINAWGDRHSSRVSVFQVIQAITTEYQEYCQEHNLLDYAAQLKLFMETLAPHPVFQRYFMAQYQHLIADNIEESGPVVHDFIRDQWKQWQTALLVMDTEAGYRTFLGASPENASGLASLCDQHLVSEPSPDTEGPLQALEHEVQRALNPVFSARSAPADNPVAALTYTYHAYYPQMIEWTISHIRDLVSSGIPPAQIVILAPFLTDSLRFALQSQFDRLGIPSVSHRPSRALREEPAARVLLTLLNLAFPQWGFPPPPRQDIVDALIAVIDGLDPVRARLLADIVYKPNQGGAFTSFDLIQPATRDRITYAIGERFEYFRTWLQDASLSHEQQPIPPDYFLSRLFGEVLSQPGFGFHADVEKGRIAAQIIESARKFRQVLYPHQYLEPDWNSMGQEYLQLVNEGVLSALYTSSWSDEGVDAVFLAPAFTFLMRNRTVDYQFWLDIGSESWWRRLDQPLTHPYVLTRHYPASYVWTDVDEEEKQREMLHRLMTGLIRRCRQQIYLGISDLGEQGFEQRGPMLYVFQQILQRYGQEATQ